VNRPALLLALLLALPAAAAEPADYAGRWVFDEASGDRDALDRTLDRATEDFPKLFRGLVRRKLEPTARIVEWFRFEPGADRMTVKTDLNEDGLTTDLARTPVPTTSPAGEAATISRWMADGWLHSRGENPRGSTTYRFAIEPSGVLRLDVTVEADRLPRPLTYSLHYRKSE
jgi:hypothetical protein